MVHSLGSPVFVAVAQGDPLGAELVGELRLRLGEVMTSEDLPPMDDVSLLREIVRGCDRAIVVLPLPGNRHQARLMLEAGIAAGLGLPIVVVADQPSPGGPLRGLPTFEPTALMLALDGKSPIAASPWSYDPPSRPVSKSSSTAYQRLAAPSDPLQSDAPPSRFERLSDDALAAEVAHLFRHFHARVLEDKHQSESSSLRPDFVVWHDDLLNLTGLPTVVEVLRSGASPARQRSRLRKTLSVAGSPGLIAVSAKPCRTDVWTGNGQVIVTVAADLLEQVAATSTDMKDLVAALSFKAAR